MKFAIVYVLATLWVGLGHCEVARLEQLELSMKQMKHEVDLIQEQRKQDHQMLQSFLNFFQREMKMSRRHHRRDRYSHRAAVDEIQHPSEVRSSRVARSPNPQTSSENAAKSINWLFTAVRELKNEFAEFSKSYDAPKTSQKLETFEKELQFVKNDMGALAHQLSESKATGERLSVEVEQTKLDVSDISLRSDKLQSELQLLHSEIASVKSSAVAVTSPAPISFTGRLRHSHVTAELQTLAGNLDKVSQALDKLQTETTNTSSTLTTLQQDWTALKFSVEDLASITDTLGLRTQGTEIQLALLTEQVANATVGSATLAKLEASQVNLQDSLQLVQEEFDYEVRDLRNLLTKVHANSTHAVGLAEKVLLQHQVDQETLSRAITDVSKLNIDAEKQRTDLTLLQNQVLNLTLKECFSLNNQLTQELGYRAMELEIIKLNKEVQNLNQSLENFTSAFSIPTGFLDASLDGVNSTTTTGHAAGITATLTDSTTENAPLLETSTEKNGNGIDLSQQMKIAPSAEGKNAEKEEDSSSSSSEESAEGS